jgi:hypothetical protein
MVIIDKKEIVTEEEKRLRQDRDRKVYWKKWGTYVSERQWAVGEHFDDIDNKANKRQSEKTTREWSIVVKLI